MEIIKRIGFFVFVVFILFLFIWALYLPKKEATQTIKKTLEEQKQRLDLFFQGVTFQEAVGSVKYWEIKAKSSSLNKDTGVVTLKDSQGTFFKSGRPVLKFISPQAVWNMNKKEIHLKDAVGYDVKSEEGVQKFLAEAQKYQTSVFTLPVRYRGAGEGYFFMAKNLSWKLADQKLLCRGGIWLNKGDIFGQGRELTADVGLEKVKLRGDPRIILSNQYLTTIEAREFQVDSVKDILSAEGGVTLRSSDVKITAARIIFKQRLNLIEIFKAVNITYRDILATGDKALYDMKKEMIDLLHNTRLKRGKNTLTGDKIAVSLKDKTFKISGRTKAVITEEELK